MDAEILIEKGEIPISSWTKFFIIFRSSIIVLIASFLITISLTASIIPFVVSKTKGLIFLVNIPFLFLLFVGSYGLYKVKDYSKLTIVSNELNVESKREIVQSLIPILKLKETSENDLQYFKFYYWKYFLSPSLTITILVDEKGFYINTMDTARATTMMIGRFDRVTKKIKKAIIERINELSFNDQ
jgi:hypothetical protein